MPDTEASSNLSPRVSRAGIIQTVQTPLGFFSLIVLVVEVIFGMIAGLSEGSDRTYLIVGMLILIFLLVGIVSFMAIWRPESLKGVRPVLNKTNSTAIVSEVSHIQNPSILCASTTQFEELGFEKDVATLKKRFKKVHIEHHLSSGRIRDILTTLQFDVIHILSYVEPKDGALVLTPDDKLSSEGFASLLEICKAHLVVLATCDSINLASKVSRTSNIIAATTVIATDNFIAWAECFYNLLSRGHSLSRAYDIARTTTNAPMVLLMKQDVTFS